jgi:hypothetical protein
LNWLIFFIEFYFQCHLLTLGWYRKLSLIYIFYFFIGLSRSHDLSNRFSRLFWTVFNRSNIIFIFLSQTIFLTTYQVNPHIVEFFLLKNTLITSKFFLHLKKFNLIRNVVHEMIECTILIKLTFIYIYIDPYILS